jgi:hypothetical protein
MQVPGASAYRLNLASLCAKVMAVTDHPLSELHVFDAILVLTCLLVFSSCQIREHSKRKVVLFHSQSLDEK